MSNVAALRKLEQQLTLWAAKQPRADGAKLAIETADYLSSLATTAEAVTDEDASTLAHTYLMDALTKYAAETKAPRHDCVPKVIGMAMTEACKEILRLRAIKGDV